MVYKEIPYSEHEAAPAKGEDDTPSISNATQHLPTRADVANLSAAGHDNNKVVYTLVNIRHVPKAVDTSSADSSQLSKQSTHTQSHIRAVSAEPAYVHASTQTENMQSKGYVSKGL